MFTFLLFLNILQKDQWMYRYAELAVEKNAINSVFSAPKAKATYLQQEKLIWYLAVMKVRVFFLTDVFDCNTVIYLWKPENALPCVACCQLWYVWPIINRIKFWFRHTWLSFSRKCMASLIVFATGSFQVCYKLSVPSLAITSPSPNTCT